MVHLLGLLRKEHDKIEMSQYIGLECDSDVDIDEDESDPEYSSDDGGVYGKSLDYDLDKMFEIVSKRDFNKWSMGTIHHRYTKIAQGETDRKQISR